MTRNTKPKGLNTEEVVRVHKHLKAKGFTLQAIADKLGCTHTSVNYHLNKAKGITKPPKKRVKARTSEMISMSVPEDTEGKVAAFVGSPREVAQAVREIIS